MSDEAKAKQYMDEAEKKLKSSGSVFSSIFGSVSFLSGFVRLAIVDDDLF